MKLIFTIAFCALFSISLIAQTSQILTLQPTANDCYFAIVGSLEPDNTPNTTYPELAVSVWTTNSVFTVYRCYIKFDFTQLPANATIQSAYLSLYADPNAANGYAGEPTYGDQNACGIYRVVQSWDKNVMTWNTQPQYSESSYISLPQSTSTDEDYTNINVTQMVDSMVSVENYGLLLKMMQETAYYNSQIFYSPTGSVPNKQPKLIINYTVPTGIANVNSGSSIDIFPNPATKNVTVKVINVDNTNLQMSVIDCIGRVVKKINVGKDQYAKGFTMDVSAFSPGIYTMNIENEQSIISKKFVVN